MIRPALAATLLLAIMQFGFAHTGAGRPYEGRNLAAACANCHGTNGARSLGDVPALAGQKKELLVRQMQDFRSGVRAATVMQQIAKGYTDDQIESLAAFFAAQKAL
jgi:cytochrome subunit of sulfide dehydrogenase